MQKMNHRYVLLINPQDSRGASYFHELKLTKEEIIAIKTGKAMLLRAWKEKIYRLNEYGDAIV